MNGYVNPDGSNNGNWVACACGQHSHRPIYSRPQPETRGDFLRAFAAFAALIVSVYIIVLVATAATLPAIR